MLEVYFQTLTLGTRYQSQLFSLKAPFRLFTQSQYSKHEQKESSKQYPAQQNKNTASHNPEK